MKRVGILGASGYTGAELMRLLAHHPDLELVVASADSAAGTAVADSYPSLAAHYRDLRYGDASDLRSLYGLDVVFLALPHGASGEVVPELLGRVGHIVDLGADFRLRKASLYPQWYGNEHPAPELLAKAVHGIPELYRDQLRGAELIAAAGCYVTTSVLAIAPLVAAGLIEPTRVVVNAVSGATGAGKSPKPSSHFATVEENFTAYGLLTHRHTPEIEQASGAQVLFTPHLAPMNRGILATIYAAPAAGATLCTGVLLEAYRKAYQGERFVVVSQRIPQTKAALGSNSVHLTARYDERTGTVLALSSLDNLVKGASGQALQCANLALGLDEGAGLSAVGVYP